MPVMLVVFMIILSGTKSGDLAQLSSSEPKAIRGMRVTNSHQRRDLREGEWVTWRKGEFTIGQENDFTKNQNHSLEKRL
ncbi:MAG TPA: hypothetical protein VK050_01275 [Flavobacteriaceae bacterium]|nr:hypothetical protein [Flavobacteriaceae bacterium]